MVDEKRKVVIIHPPKTGGQALQKALGLPMGMRPNPHKLRRHDTLEELWFRWPEVKSWPTYILVRNPYARLVSMYFYHTQVEHRYNGPARRYIQSFKSCDEFLKRAEFDFTSRLCQYNWRDRITEPCAWYGRVDGAYNGLIRPLFTESVAFQAREYFGLNDVPVYNASEHDDYRSYYTPESAERVYKFFHEDFDRYGYDRRVAA